METDKKTAAAIAAVMSYLKTEEEMIAMRAMSAPGVARAAAPAFLNVWGMRG